MEINGLKLVGIALVVAGLMTGTFLAGSHAAGNTTSADPEPTSTATAMTKDGTDKNVVLVGDGQDQIEDVNDVTDEPTPAPQPPEQAPPPPVEPTPVPPADPEPAPEPPVELTPVNEAPEVDSILPSGGSFGVAADANIVVWFSEPMDKASVQAAFNLSTGNCGIFAWNSQATKMTFNPCNDWAYGTVVEVEIYDSAADKLGLGMEHHFQSSFRVLRQLTTKIYSDPERDGHVYYNGFVSLDAQPIIVSRQARGFVSFDLSDLPQDLVQITSASVHIRQWDSAIGAYGPATGNLLIQSLTYGGLSSGDFYANAHKLCALLCLGNALDSRLFSDNPLDGWKSADMLLAVRKDWNDRANRNYLSQFRLRFETECFDSYQVCGNTSGVSLYSGNSMNKPFLQVTYLAP